MTKRPDGPAAHKTIGYHRKSKLSHLYGAELPDSPRNVILFAYYFLPDNTSGVQRAVRIAKYLPQFGFETFVIASSQAGVNAGHSGVEHVPVPGNRASRYQET